MPERSPMSTTTEVEPVRDARGAWIVEALIVALVLMLVGKSIGLAISLFAFIVAFAFGALLILGLRAARNRLTNKR